MLDKLSRVLAALSILAQQQSTRRRRFDCRAARRKHNRGLFRSIGHAILVLRFFAVKKASRQAATRNVAATVASIFGQTRTRHPWTNDRYKVHSSVDRLNFSFFRSRRENGATRAAPSLVESATAKRRIEQYSRKTFEYFPFSPPSFHQERSFRLDESGGRRTIETVPRRDDD